MLAAIRSGSCAGSRSRQVIDRGGGQHRHARRSDRSRRSPAACSMHVARRWLDASAARRAPARSQPTRPRPSRHAIAGVQRSVDRRRAAGRQSAPRRSGANARPAAAMQLSCGSTWRSIGRRIMPRERRCVQRGRRRDRRRGSASRRLHRLSIAAIAARRHLLDAEQSARVAAVVCGDAASDDRAMRRCSASGRSPRRSADLGDDLGRVAGPSNGAAIAARIARAACAGLAGRECTSAAGR